MIYNVLSEGWRCNTVRRGWCPCRTCRSCCCGCNGLWLIVVDFPAFPSAEPYTSQRGTHLFPSRRRTQLPTPSRDARQQPAMCARPQLPVAASQPSAPATTRSHSRRHLASAAVHVQPWRAAEASYRPNSEGVCWAFVGAILEPPITYFWQGGGVPRICHVSPEAQTQTVHPSSHATK